MPVGEGVDGFGAHLGRGVGVAREGGDGGGIGGLAEAEVGVDDAADEGLAGGFVGLAGERGELRILQQRGEFRERGGDGLVVDGDGGFGDHERVGIIEKTRDGGAFPAAQREQRGHAHGG